MAIVQISKIQNRRGLQQDLPQLAGGELGWSIDSRKLYIGNGTLAEGAPVEGQTEVLTEFSIINFTSGFAGVISSTQANVTVLQGNVVVINSQISALQAGVLNSNVVALSGSTQNSVIGVVANNAVFSYTLTENGNQRTGSIKIDRVAGTATVAFDEEYNQTGTTLTAFNITANTAYSTVWANTINPANLTYRITSL
jgi:hypothetical protein